MQGMLHSSTMRVTLGCLCLSTLVLADVACDPPSVYQSKTTCSTQFGTLSISSVPTISVTSTTQTDNKTTVVKATQTVLAAAPTKVVTQTVTSTTTVTAAKSTSTVSTNAAAVTSSTAITVTSALTATSTAYVTVVQTEVAGRVSTRSLTLTSDVYNTVVSGSTATQTVYTTMTSTLISTIPSGTETVLLTTTNATVFTTTTTSDVVVAQAFPISTTIVNNRRMVKGAETSSYAQAVQCTQNDAVSVICSSTSTSTKTSTPATVTATVTVTSLKTSTVKAPAATTTLTNGNAQTVWITYTSTLSTTGATTTLVSTIQSTSTTTQASTVDATVSTVFQTLQSTTLSISTISVTSTVIETVTSTDQEGTLTTTFAVGETQTSTVTYDDVSTTTTTQVLQQTVVTNYRLYCTNDVIGVADFSVHIDPTNVCPADPNAVQHGSQVSSLSGTFYTTNGSASSASLSSTVIGANCFSPYGGHGGFVSQTPGIDLVTSDGLTYGAYYSTGYIWQLFQDDTYLSNQAQCAYAQADLPTQTLYGMYCNFQDGNILSSIMTLNIGSSASCASGGYIVQSLVGYDYGQTLPGSLAKVKSTDQVNDNCFYPSSGSLSSNGLSFVIGSTAYRVYYANGVYTSKSGYENGLGYSTTTSSATGTCRFDVIG